MRKLIFIATLLIVSLYACNKKNTASLQTNQYENFKPSDNNYEEDWKEIEHMESKGLGKQIITRAEFILQKALAEKNTSQIFKALVYRSKYINQVEEESNFKILAQFEKEILTAEFPIKQLLHSAVAELYHQYYLQNIWRFNKRTKVVAGRENDIKTWDLDRILSKIDEHYQSSISELEALKTYPTNNLVAVLSSMPDNKDNFVEDASFLRPSLFDFLADRVINYYQYGEGRISTPQKAFQLPANIAFAPIDKFSNYSFETLDTTAKLFRTTQLFQLVLREHLKDKETSVLVDFNLKRLLFVKNNIQSKEKDSLFIAALQDFSMKYEQHKAEIDFRLAQFYFQKSTRFNNTDEPNEWKKKAHQICTLHAQKENFGGLQCKALLQQIEGQTLTFTVEKVYLPEKPLPIAISYKNIDTAYFSIYLLPHGEKGKTNEIHKDYLRRILKQQALRTWVSPLNNPKDFNRHVTEIQTTNLPVGKYLIVASSQEKFTVDQGLLSSVEFSVSNLSFIKENSNNKDELRLFVLNRTSGNIVPNAKLLLYSSTYNYSTKTNKKKLEGSYFSNKAGEVNITQLDQNKEFSFVLVYDGDTLDDSYPFFAYNRNRNRNKKVQTFYFTDRAIYRPGQTIYFKGIVVERDQYSNQLKTNYSTEVIFRSPNGQKIASRNVVSNDYGSFQGSFEIPSSGLTGRHRIQSKQGNYYFSVEEYKRPTFEVQLDTSSTQQKINSTIELTGKVRAYSGAPMSNAKLNYRVVRRASFPYWSYRRNYPKDKQQEIAKGKVEAKADGSFEFAFFAETDPDVSNLYQPYFNFEVSIDATSQSGETQTIVQNIRLGTQHFYLSTNLSERVQLKTLKQLIVKAVNTNDKEVSEKLKLTLWKLKDPKQIKSQKPWSIQNDVFSSSQSLVIDLDTLKRETQLIVEQVKSNTPLSVFGNLKSGNYELAIEGINDKKDVRLKQRFTLFDEEARALAFPQFIFFQPLKITAEPGEKASFLIGTGLKNLNLFYQVVKRDQVIEERWIQLNKEQQKIEIPIQESDRGGIQLLLLGVHSNRRIQLSQRINVPFSNKKLALQLGTFRNKAEPGSKEKWSMNITGPKGEALAAEVLIGMYDQSLDRFTSKNWQFQLNRQNYNAINWAFDNGYRIQNSHTAYSQRIATTYPKRIYPSLNWFGFYLGRNYNIRGARASAYKASAPFPVANIVEEEVEFSDEVKTGGLSAQFGDQDDEGSIPFGLTRKMPPAANRSNSSPSNDPINSTRTNFNETAFFYPQLKTDATGAVSFEFTLPEALTQWKFRALAHSKDLKVGTIEQSIRTQKQLSISLTSPRFFREKDQLTLKATITNITDQFQSGSARLQFFDAFTNQKIDISTGKGADLSFSIPPNESVIKFWNVSIPLGLKAIKYRIEAQAETFSDGEEKVIPVLLNRSLVTESLPIAIRGNQEKTFSFDRFIQNHSPTLEHASYTVEFTPNPIWYAVQALPYLVKEGSACSEQVFTRFYANAIAEQVANSNPRIKEVFDLWKQENSDELSSKLFQNEALKTILIEETPWLKQAENEAEQKKRLALLFDFNKMTQEKHTALKKLKELQLPNGGWSWYKGMRDNRYITQYIVNGLGHLKQLGISIEKDPEIKQMLAKGIHYLDQRIEEDYEQLKKSKSKLKDLHLGPIQIHYLYTKSFFPESEKTSDAYHYYLKQATQYWQEQSLYMKGMIGLTLHRLQAKSTVPSSILAAVKDNSIQSEELGMYWKNNQSGYYWYNSAIETQALMIEFFKALDSPTLRTDKDVEELNIWLLKEKQTQAWSNTKATALACYALLIGNGTLLESPSSISLKVGEASIVPNAMEAGTGYFKKTYPKQSITKELGNISLSKNNKGIAWGAAYWQYFEELDKVTAAEINDLSIRKALFKVEVSNKGEIMKPIEFGSIKVGDNIRVRIVIESQRNLEFVHLKDTRASGFEPINVLSGYRYQDGLGYYESTKDASSNFFIDHLAKGTYVFEYDLRATVEGDFSNGFASLQCQYAPEFNAHSNGKRVNIQALK